MIFDKHELDNVPSYSDHKCSVQTDLDRFSYRVYILVATQLDHVIIHFRGSNCSVGTYRFYPIQSDACSNCKLYNTDLPNESSRGLNWLITSRLPNLSMQFWLNAAFVIRFFNTRKHAHKFTLNSHFHITKSIIVI